MPMRIAPGHCALPRCIRSSSICSTKGIEGNVVLLFQTGCGMVVTTGYPKTAFRVPYLHNLFQNGAATLSGVVEVFHQRQKRGEYPKGTDHLSYGHGDGGMDIGMGSALGTALRGHRMIIFEYDNGWGAYEHGLPALLLHANGCAQLHLPRRKGSVRKILFPQGYAGADGCNAYSLYRTVAESNPSHFDRKAAKAAAYSREFGTAYIKALSACPLNWNDKPNLERSVISAAVDCPAISRSTRSNAASPH